MTLNVYDVCYKDNTLGEMEKIIRRTNWNYKESRYLHMWAFVEIFFHSELKSYKSELPSDEICFFGKLGLCHWGQLIVIFLNNQELEGRITVPSNLPNFEILLHMQS